MGWTNEIAKGVTKPINLKIGIIYIYMEFSEDSEFFLEFLIDKFKDFIKERPERLQKNMTKKLILKQKFH